MSRETSHGQATWKQLAAAFDLTPQALWKARQPVPARAKRVPSKPMRAEWTSAEHIEARARAIVAEHPAWGTRKVWAVLRREGVRAGRKRVAAIMGAAGLLLDPITMRESHARGGHVMVPQSNRRWATDLTTVWTRRDGLVAVVPLIDCGDRFLLQLVAMKSQESVAVIGPLEAELRAAFGEAARVPHGLELLTDHGPQYTGADCEALCKVWGIDHIFSAVGRPTGNAVAERVIETTKVELIWTRDWESLAELQQALEVWRVMYNTQRPHQSLGWLTPAEKRANNLGLSLQATG